MTVASNAVQRGIDHRSTSFCNMNIFIFVTVNPAKMKKHLGQGLPDTGTTVQVYTWALAEV